MVRTELPKKIAGGLMSVFKRGIRRIQLILQTYAPICALKRLDKLRDGKTLRPKMLHCGIFRDPKINHRIPRATGYFGFGYIVWEPTHLFT